METADHDAFYALRVCFSQSVAYEHTMALHHELLAMTCAVAQSHALGIFGDLDNLQVAESAGNCAQFQATLRIPEMIFLQGPLLFHSVAPSSDQAEVLAMAPLIQMYRVKKAMLASEGTVHRLTSTQSAEFHLLHLFLVHLRMQLGHNPQAIRNIDTALTAEVDIGMLDHEELYEAIEQAIIYNRELRQDLAEEVAAIWHTFSAAAM